MRRENRLDRSARALLCLHHERAELAIRFSLRGFWDIHPAQRSVWIPEEACETLEITGATFSSA